jgi:COMPASS component SWD3
MVTQEATSNATADNSNGNITSNANTGLQRSIHVGTPLRRIPPSQALNVDDPHVKQDVVRLIGLYLQQEGYSATAFALQDEANVKLRDKAHKHAQVKRMRQAVLDGDWDTVRKLAHKHVLRRNHRSALYLIYRQEYLELIDRHEYQRAFIFLTKRLKPVESQSHVQGVQHEFHDLCYLLTCRSVQDAKSFSHWGGVTSSREKLADHFERMILSEYPEVGSHHHDQESHDHRRGHQQQQQRQQQIRNKQLLRVDPPAPSPDRLVRLLQQAAAYQIEFSPYHPALEPRVESLMEDFRCRVVPDSPDCIFGGHTNNVKCVEFVGRAGNLLTSGSSDRTICVWDLEQARQRQRRRRGRVSNSKAMPTSFQVLFYCLL